MLSASMKTPYLPIMLFAILVIILGFYLYSKQAYQSTFQTTGIRISHSATNSFENGSVYLALSPSQRNWGYMNWSNIGNCNNSAMKCIGMLFVFDNSQNLCFWMKNTLIPLRQVWINQAGVVTYIYNATPESTKIVCWYGKDVLETQDTSIGINDSISLV